MLNPNTFKNSLKKLCPDFRNKTFLLAVSGGADSMVLLDLFKDCGLHFQVAHVNYGLREEESEKDQKLVEKICAKYDIPFHLYRVTEIDHQPENSIQNWARNLRYGFFRKIMKEQNMEFLATAHHLNDELETFLINLSKAAGIKGLSGIPANSNRILRPLLSFSKEEIYAFAKSKKIEFREDASNQKNDYLRNKIRNEIVPKLQEINVDFLVNFGKSLSYLNQTKNFVQEKISEIENKIITQKEEFLLLKKDLFFEQSDFVQFEILRKYGFDGAEEILKIKNAETGKTFFSNGYELTIDRETLNLKKLAVEDLEEVPEEIFLNPNGANEIIIPEKESAAIAELGSLNWKFDAEKLFFPLKIRFKKEGDIFHPTGMKGKKKISKFFKDKKIPILAQQKIWLLCDSNDCVLGILPFRQDRRFVATKESKEIINVKLTHS